MMLCARVVCLGITWIFSYVFYLTPWLEISLILVEIWQLFHFFLTDPFNLLDFTIFNELFCFIHIVVEEILNNRFFIAIYDQLGRFERKLIPSEYVALVGVFELLNLLPELFPVRICLIIGIVRVVILNPDQESLCELLFWRWRREGKMIKFYFT